MKSFFLLKWDKCIFWVLNKGDKQAIFNWGSHYSAVCRCWTVCAKTSLDSLCRDITVQCIGTNIVKYISQCLHHTLIITKNRPEETELPWQNDKSEAKTNYSTDQVIHLSDWQQFHKLNHHNGHRDTCKGTIRKPSTSSYMQNMQPGLKNNNSAHATYLSEEIVNREAMDCLSSVVEQQNVPYYSNFAVQLN